MTTTTSTNASERDLKLALAAWQQAVLTKDRTLFNQVYHQDLIYAHATGVVENKAQAIEHIAGSSTPYLACELTETNIRMLGDTALVRGRLVFRQERTDKSINVIDLVYLTAWTKNEHGWQMIARQSARPTPPTPPPAKIPAAQPTG